MNNHIGAEVSDCGKYRYQLWRNWARGERVLWIMLNPSTADAVVDDPTIRRCAGFTQQWKCSGFTVVNLFALRSKNPADLARAKNPQGPDDPTNRVVLLDVMNSGQYRHRVVAWGSGNKVPNDLFMIAERVFWRSFREIRLECLGMTKGGHPRHPLYVPRNTPLMPWALQLEPGGEQGE